MDDAYLVHVFDSLHDLFEKELGVFLGQFASLPDIVEEIATRAELHYY